MLPVEIFSSADDVYEIFVVVACACLAAGAQKPGLPSSIVSWIGGYPVPGLCRILRKGLVACSFSHASADAYPDERRGTVLELAASGKSSEAQGLVSLRAGWGLLEDQLATQITWPQKVAALLAHQDGVERG